MVVKIYISLTSGLKEVKKRQQKILMILDSKNIKYDIVDISEPGREEDKDFMQSNSTSKGGTASDPDPRHPLPPQVFNDKEYCGDFDQFELANEVDNLEDFLKLPPEERPQVHKSTLDTSKIDENHPNGKVIEDEANEDKENKTDDQEVNEESEDKEENVVAQESIENEAQKENDEKTDTANDTEKVNDEEIKEHMEDEVKLTETEEPENEGKKIEQENPSEELKIEKDDEKIKEHMEDEVKLIETEEPENEGKKIEQENPSEDIKIEKDDQLISEENKAENNDETKVEDATAIATVNQEQPEDAEEPANGEAEEFGDGIVSESEEIVKAEEQSPIESKPTVEDVIEEEEENEEEEEEEELEAENTEKEKVELGNTEKKELTESEKLILSEQQDH